MKGSMTVRTVELTVPTIKCDGCVEKIRETLIKRRGIENVEGDPNRKRISVTFNPEQLGDAEIRAAIADAGFVAG